MLRPGISGAASPRYPTVAGLDAARRRVKSGADRRFTSGARWVARAAVLMAVPYAAGLRCARSRVNAAYTDDARAGRPPCASLRPGTPGGLAIACSGHLMSARGLAPPSRAHCPRQWAPRISSPPGRRQSNRAAARPGQVARADRPVTALGRGHNRLVTLDDRPERRDTADPGLPRRPRWCGASWRGSWTEHSRALRSCWPLPPPRAAALEPRSYASRFSPRSPSESRTTSCSSPVVDNRSGGDGSVSASSTVTRCNRRRGASHRSQLVGGASFGIAWHPFAFWPSLMFDHRPVAHHLLRTGGCRSPVAPRVERPMGAHRRHRPPGRAAPVAAKPELGDAGSAGPARRRDASPCAPPGDSRPIASGEVFRRRRGPSDSRCAAPVRPGRRPGCPGSRPRA